MIKQDFISFQALKKQLYWMSQGRPILVLKYFWDFPFKI